MHPRARHSQECFFLREEVLIYDAPSLPRKDNRFDQELPSIGGSKVWRKGSRPVAWLDSMVEILVVQNIANMYCTECIIGIVQNAGTSSRLRFARTRRDEG